MHYEITNLLEKAPQGCDSPLTQLEMLEWTGAPKPEPLEVEIVHPSYQPSKAELEEDLRVDASFEEAVDALAQPVSIRHIARPKPGH